MQVSEARIVYQLLDIEAGDQLKTTAQLVQYLTACLPPSEVETFMVACLNPKRRPITRMQVRTGPLVASRVSSAEVFRVLLQTEAKCFACLRTQPTGVAQPSLADGRLLFQLREAGIQLGVPLIDYLIVRLEPLEIHSWRDTDPRRN